MNDEENFRDRDYKPFPSAPRVINPLSKIAGTPQRDNFVPEVKDLPRAGQLSSQVFNDLTSKIVDDMQETVAAQINEVSNRRQQVKLQMEQLVTEIDRQFANFEKQVEDLKRKIEEIATSVRKNVEAETKGMVALSQRLEKFATSVNSAHDAFFTKEH